MRASVRAMARVRVMVMVRARVRARGEGEGKGKSKGKGKGDGECVHTKWCVALGLSPHQKSQRKFPTKPSSLTTNCKLEIPGGKQLRIPVGIFGVD